MEKTKTTVELPLDLLTRVKVAVAELTQETGKRVTLQGVVNEALTDWLEKREGERRKVPIA